MLEVNGEKNLMKVKGLVRPKDILTDNTVYSYNIANAEIAYKQGNLHKRFLKPGLLQKTITLGIGAGLLGLAYIGFF
jgi:flagellar L-ring protein precursor FlgH